MAQVNIRIDDELKKKADALFAELGLNMTTAFNIFIKTAVRQHGLPIELSLDQFYSETNMSVLLDSIREAYEGNLTEHDLVQE